MIVGDYDGMGNRRGWLMACDAAGCPAEVAFITRWGVYNMARLKHWQFVDCPGTQSHFCPAHRGEHPCPDPEATQFKGE